MALMRGKRDLGQREHEFSELDRGFRLRSLLAPQKEHLIVNRESGQRQFFNLERDPSEQTDLTTDPAIPALERKLDDFLESLTPGAAKLGEEENEEQLRKLESLGYL